MSKVKKEVQTKITEKKMTENKPFLVYCYEIYNRNCEFCFSLYKTKTVSLFGIKNLIIDLNFNLENNVFSLVVNFMSTQIIEDIDNCPFESMRKLYLPKITKNMSQEDFCREFDIGLKNFSKQIKKLRYCKIQNKIVEEEIIPPPFPKDYFSDWKDAVFRETQCLVCYEECSTFVKCCDKPFCIPCLSKIEKKHCPHCNFNHYEYINIHDNERGNSFYITD